MSYLHVSRAKHRSADTSMSAWNRDCLEFRLAEQFGDVQARLGGNSPARLFLVETASGDNVVVKALSCAGGQDPGRLLAEADHLGWLNRHLSSYPAVIDRGIKAGCVYYVTPYINRFTLAQHIDQLSGPSAVEICVKYLVQAYSQSDRYFQDRSDLRSQVFRRAYIDRVKSRVQRLLATPGSPNKLTDSASEIEINGCRYVHPLLILARLSKDPERLSCLMPRSLSVAVHGDLVPSNILVGANERDAILIDPRGEVLWVGGTPFWDPMYDIAKMKFFLFSWREISSGRLKFKAIRTRSSSGVSYETQCADFDQDSLDELFDHTLAAHQSSTTADIMNEEYSVR